MPFCHFTLKAQKPSHPSYPKTLKTLGNHVRKKRIDLKLHQKDIAKEIGVSKTSICSWENNLTSPCLRFMPKVIRFLGYVPLKLPEDPIGRLRFYKLVNGLSYKRLGKLMGKHPEQLTDWLSGRVRPCRKNVESIVKFVNGVSKKRG